MLEAGMEDSHDSRATTTDRRRLLKGLGAGIGVTTLAGCSGGDQSETTTDTTADDDGSQDTTEGQDTQSIPTGGILRVASSGDPQNLDPHTTTIDVAQKVLENVVESLFEIDENLDVQPLLAEDYQVSDDETTYEITLKDGVTFHNGDELTSADVKYSIERILDPDLGSPRAANFELVDTIGTPDDSTVVFELAEPFAPFIIGLAESAGIIPEGVDDEVDLQQNPIGTGAFRIEGWETDERVSFTRFDDYHADDLPYLDDVRFDVIPEAATRLTQLQDGSAHVMFGVPFQRADDIDQGQNTNLQATSGLWKMGFWFNTDTAPFDDARVRRAISHAINREQLVQGVLFGRGQVAHDPIPPTSSWRDQIDTAEPHEFSRDRARSLLDDAGVDPASISTSIKASRTPGPTYADSATLVQSMLSQLEMNVEVDIMDFSTWLQEVWVDKNYEMAVGSWSGRIDPDGWYYRQFHSKGAWNRWNYANDEVDQLLEDGRTTTDREERANIYSQVDQIVSEDAPQVYLFNREEMTGLKNSVGGYELTPTQDSEFDSTYLEE
jgi:peptide/nickel transport system substrate-binding protein